MRTIRSGKTSLLKLKNFISRYFQAKVGQSFVWEDTPWAVGRIELFF